MDDDASPPANVQEQSANRGARRDVLKDCNAWSWHLGGTALEVHLARRRVRSCVLDATGDEDAAAATEAVAGEFVGNAVLHAGAPIVMDLTVVPGHGQGAAPPQVDASPATAAIVRVVVSDSSVMVPVARRRSDLATTGRGMALVQALATRWGVDLHPDGKRVWAEIDSTADGIRTPLAQASDANSPGVPSTSGDAAFGRYQTVGDRSSDRVRVRLLGVPVRVWARAVEWHDDLMREAALLATGLHDGQIRPDTLPARLLALVSELRRRYRADGRRSDATREVALATGQDTLDLDYVVPRSMADSLPALAALFDELREYCSTGTYMLTLPPDDTVGRFQLWYLEEFIGQIGGAPPTRWTGALD